MTAARSDAARGFPARRGTARGGDQRGVTLIELLIALTIGALIAGAATGLMVLTLQTTDSTTQRLSGSASAFQTNARFGDDIRSATPIDANLAVARGEDGCGGDSTSLLRALVRTASGVQVRSYSLADGGERLERRVCSGADLAAALAAAPSVDRVAKDLADGSDAPSVSCRANPGADPAPLSPAGDEQCRIVTLDVVTTSGYTFQLEGHRDSNQTPVVSPTSVKRCTLMSSADTWVSSYDPDTNYGREWHTSTFWRRTGSYGYLFSFFKVDLLGPCTGPGEPAFLPGGKRLLSADLQLWLVRNGSPDCCGYESVHALRVVGDPWDEATVTWHTRPNVRPDSNTQFFETGRPFTVQKPFNFTVLDEVNRWYDGPAAGGWSNYGWRLDRGDAPAPDDTGSDNGFWWGARESSDNRQWPKLTVTWE